MTSDVYRAKHLVYGGEMFDAVKMRRHCDANKLPAVDEAQHARYFDISNYHSWLYFAKQKATLQESNVQLLYTPKKFPALCAVKRINYGDELFVFNELYTVKPAFQRDYCASLLNELDEEQSEKLNMGEDDTAEERSEHETASSCAGSLAELDWFLNDNEENTDIQDNDAEQQRSWQSVDGEEQRGWESEHGHDQRDKVEDERSVQSSAPPTVRSTPSTSYLGRLKQFVGMNGV